MAALFSHWYKRLKAKHLVIVYSVFLVLAWSILTIRQNNYWREPIAFYKRTLEFSPYSDKAHSNLATIYAGIGKIEEAIEHYKKAIEINPAKPHGYYNLGNVYRENSRSEEAIPKNMGTSTCSKSLSVVSKL